MSSYEVRRTVYEDERGRKYLVEIPKESSDEDAYMGVVIGPPDIVGSLELPEPFATNLHNQLFARNLWDVRAIGQQKQSLAASLMAAIRIDVQTLMTAYHEFETITE